MSCSLMKFWLALLSIIINIHVVSCLYAEEAGRWDWHKAVFKDVKEIEWSKNGKRLYYSTHSRLIGSVSVKDGRLNWRRLTAADVADLKSVGKALLVSLKSGVVNVFSQNGALLWESKVAGSEDDKVLALLGETDNEYPALLTINEVTGILKVHPILVNENQEVVWGEVSSISPPEGVESGWAKSITSHYVTDTTLFLTYGDSLRTLELSKSAWSAVEIPAKNAKIDFVLGDSLFLHSGEGCYEYKKGQTALTAFTSVLADTCVRGLSIPQYDEYKFGTVSTIFPAKSPSHGYAVKFAGGNTGAVVDGELLWNREDGLGAVSKVVSTDLPKEDSDDSKDVITTTQSPWTTYQTLLVKQADILKHAFQNLPAMTKKLQAVFTGEAIEEDYSSSDSFGLQRLLMVTSDTTLYCITTVGGEIKWQINARSLIKKHKPSVGKTTIVKLFKVPSQGSSHIIHLFLWVTDSTEDFIISLTQSGDVKNVRKTTTLEMGSIVPYFQYSSSGNVFNALLFLDKDFNVVVHPEDAKCVSTRRLYFHRLHEEEGVMKGYEIEPQTLKSSVAWQLSVTSNPEERIVASSMKTFDLHQYTTTENIRVYGNVTAGKTEVLSKYINPNAVLVVTAVPPDESGGTPVESEELSSKRAGGGYLVLYLIDGVTGSLLGSMVQPNAVPPVQVIALEHMFLYHFFNTKRARYQLGVWELFQDTDLYKGVTATSTTNFKYIWQAFTGFQDENKFSSFEIAPPKIAPLAFSFPTSVRALGVTVSDLGVATKQIIAALSSDEIVSIDVAKHIEANTQHGMIGMSWLPLHTITYNSTVLGIDSVHTFSTLLESTCLMVALGNDIFFSRVSSGKPFDVLHEDFGYAPLFLTVAAAIILTMVLSQLSARKSLQARWL